jgi:hypothetical protein
MARVFTDGGAQTLLSANGTLYNLSSFSVAFWLFRTATPAAERSLISFFNASGAWHLGLTAANLITAYYSFSTADKIRLSSTAPGLNAWVHVVVTHNNLGLANTDFTFYFNGKSEAGTASSTGSGTHSNTVAGALTIGSDGAGTGFLASPAQMGGPVAIWNRAISPAEALALAGGMHPLRFQEGLVELFSLEGAAGDEGWFQRTPLAQGATNPTNAAVNPPVEPPPLLLRVS